MNNHSINLGNSKPRIDLAVIATRILSSTISTKVVPRCRKQFLVPLPEKKMQPCMRYCGQMLRPLQSDSGDTRLLSLFQRFLQCWLQSSSTRSDSALSSPRHSCAHKKPQLYISLASFRIWIHQGLRTLISTQVPKFRPSYALGASVLLGFPMTEKVKSRWSYRSFIKSRT